MITDGLITLTLDGSTFPVIKRMEIGSGKKIMDGFGLKRAYGPTYGNTTRENGFS